MFLHIKDLYSLTLWLLDYRLSHTTDKINSGKHLFTALQMTPEDFFANIPIDELIAMCVNNNTEAWEMFVKRFYRHIKLCAFREVQKSELSKSEVNEIIQEVFLNLLSHNYKTLREFYGTKDSEMNAYLAKIVYHISLRMLRRENLQKRNINALRQLLGVNDENYFKKMFEENFSPEEVQDLLKTILTGPNSSRDALIFYLHAIVGLSAREIGQLPAISLSITNVNNIVSRTKEKLRELFNKDYVRNLYFT